MGKGRRILDFKPGSRGDIPNRPLRKIMAAASVMSTSEACKTYGVFAIIFMVEKMISIAMF